MIDQKYREVIELMVSAGKKAIEMKTQGLQVDEKANDEGLVTNVDRELNQILHTQIKRAFPSHNVVSEEGQPEFEPNAEFTWYIDPIDGTSDFSRGNQEWCVMVGCVTKTESIFGAVYQPETDKVYYAQNGRGAFLKQGTESEQRLKLREKSFSPSEVIVVESRSHPDPKIQEIQDLLSITQSYQQGSLGVKLSQIAEGRANLYMNFSGKCRLWDLAGPECILRNAGGKVCSVGGQAISYDWTQNQDFYVREEFIAMGGVRYDELLTRVQSACGDEHEG